MMNLTAAPMTAWFFGFSTGSIVNTGVEKASMALSRLGQVEENSLAQAEELMFVIAEARQFFARIELDRLQVHLFFLRGFVRFDE